MGQQRTVAFAHPDSLDGEQRVAKHLAEAWHDSRDVVGATDRDDHHRHVHVAAEEARAMSLAAGSSVHSEKHRGPRNPLPVEQVADRDISGHAVDALLASDVHRQLRCTRELFGHCEIGDVAADEPGAFHSDQAEWGDLDDVIDQASHLRAGIDRRDRDGRVLGKAQPLVAAQLFAWAEAGDAAQHHARGDLAFGV